jgi:hydrogenase nickel incorporation protein HypA/HybF
VHELTVIQNAVDIAIERARVARATRIHQIELRVGQLSGIAIEAVEFAFETVCRGTLAAGSRLTIELIPPVYWCRKCQAEFESEDCSCECPCCGGFSLELRRGRELELASMEIS